MSYVSEVLADNPVLYWRLGETAGTNFNDETANNNDGTSENAPTLNQTGAISDGNPAVRFTSAQSEDVFINDNATLDLGDTYSVECWVKMTAVGSGTFRALVSKGTGAYYMRLSNTDNIQLLIAGTAVLLTSTIALGDTDYHHIVGTKTPAAGKIYIDGVDRSGVFTPAASGNNALRFCAAANDNTGVLVEFSNDTIDEVAVYGTALSGARVLVHYNAAFMPANLVAPVASGTTIVGQTLSVTDGTWGGTPAPTFTYQWQRDNLGGGIYGDIGGAVANMYTLVGADLGCNVRCVVTGTNASGSEDANSNSLGPVTAAPGTGRRRQGIMVIRDSETDIVIW